MSQEYFTVSYENPNYIILIEILKLDCTFQYFLNINNVHSIENKRDSLCFSTNSVNLNLGINGFDGRDYVISGFRNKSHRWFQQGVSDKVSLSKKCC